VAAARITPDYAAQPTTPQVRLQCATIPIHFHGMGKEIRGPKVVREIAERDGLRGEGFRDVDRVFGFTDHVMAMSYKISDN